MGHYEGGEVTMNCKQGMLVVQLTTGFGALCVGMYIGGMQDVGWLLPIGITSYVIGLLIPMGY